MKPISFLRKVKLKSVFLFIGCLFMNGDLSAQDTARVYVIDIRNEIGSGLGTYISDSYSNGRGGWCRCYCF